MKKSMKFLTVLAAVCLLSGAALVLAQESSHESMKGTLVKIDQSAKTIVIKSEEGEEEQFSFNEKTRVTGLADEGTVAALEGMEGSEVTIHFVMAGDQRLAVQIEVSEDR